MWGKRLSLDTGAIEASVASQPRWRPMIISTPQAEAKVVGTRFSLSALGAATRLDVLEGAVRLRKTHAASKDEPRDVIVRPGQTATAAPEVRLQARLLTGFLSSQVWLVPPGTALEDAPALGTPSTQLAAAAAPNAVECLRGLLTAPATGDYTFWIASKDGETPAQLWLGTDDQPTHKRKIASVTPPAQGPQAVGGRAAGPARRRGAPAAALEADFNRFPSQKSDPQRLVQGRRYYLELRRQGTGLESLDLGWSVPGQPARQEIDKQALSPFFDTSEVSK